MGSFLDLLKGNEQDWKDAAEQILPVATYVFRVQSFKLLSEDDMLICFVRAEKALDGFLDEFAPARYSIANIRFGKRNEWQFLAFAKATGLELNNVVDRLPTVIGKLFKATVTHSPNPRDPDQPFVNLRRIAAYDPDAESTTFVAPAGEMAEEEDEESSSLD